MTYQNGSATDLEDLLSQLNTFAVTTHGGWTNGYTTNPQTTDGWFELSKGSLSFSAKFCVGAQAPPQHMSIHHATAFAGTGVAPGAHTNDSGNGYNAGTTGHTNTNLDDERRVSDIGDGPFPSYRFFADDTATHDYIHVVVEISTGQFRHFGFGGLVKFGDNWVGGEYVYGHTQSTSTGGTATFSATTTLLDGLGTLVRHDGATLRITSGLLNQSPAVWGVCGSQVTTSLLTDTVGNVRRQIHGGYRMGIGMRGFGNVIGTSSAGVVGLMAIDAYYRDPSNNRVQLLGSMPDVRQFNTRNFEPGQEVTVGADTWVLFPQSMRTLAAVSGRSLYGGIAYKKVV